MKLFPFTEFYLLSPLSETEIVKRLSPEGNRQGWWHFKKKDNCYVVYYVWLYYQNLGPHMWISIDSKRSTDVIIKIIQKKSPLALKTCLSVLFILLFMLTCTLIGDPERTRFSHFIALLAGPLALFLIYMIFLYVYCLGTFLLKTTKNKKFIMGLLEAEPYTPPKQSTDNQKSDIIQ
jgi:hypothetical protein